MAKRKRTLAGPPAVANPLARDEQVDALASQAHAALAALGELAATPQEGSRLAEMTECLSNLPMVCEARGAVRAHEATLAMCATDNGKILRVTRADGSPGELPVYGPPEEGSDP